MYDRASYHLIDELLMPEKLLRRLIIEKQVPQYSITYYTNRKTGVEEAEVREYELGYHDILNKVAEILQVTHNQLEYRLQHLGMISQ